MRPREAVVEEKRFPIGLPIGPQVDQVLRVLGALARDGSVIPHEVFEKALDLDRGEARYRTIMTGVRRRLLREQNVYLEGRSAGGRGFRVLTAAQMIEHGLLRVSRARRQVGRSRILIGAAPDQELTSIERAVRDHAVFQYALVEGAFSTAQRQVAACARPTPLLPR